MPTLNAQRSTLNAQRPTLCQPPIHPNPNQNQKPNPNPNPIQSILSPTHTIPFAHCKQRCFSVYAFTLCSLLSAHFSNLISVIACSALLWLSVRVARSLYVALVDVSVRIFLFSSLSLGLARPSVFVVRCSLAVFLFYKNFHVRLSLWSQLVFSRRWGLFGCSALGLAVHLTSTYSHPCLFASRLSK